MVPTPTTNTGTQLYQQLDSENNDDSGGMQSSQAHQSEEPSEKVNENVLLESSSTGSVSGGKSASSREGYSADCSASDQASDQSSDCAASGQKQRSTMKLALNRVDLNYTSSSEMESSTPGSQQDGSSLTDESTEPGTISSASKAKTSSITAKRSLSSSLKAKNNHEATISASAAVAPALSSSSKEQHRRHLCSDHHRRRCRPRPRARDSPDDLNALLPDNSHKELANTPMFDGTQVLPQWKGVRISHPMDPRIDISTVGHMQAPVSALATTDTGSKSNTFVATASPSFDPPSMETYMQLLSVS
jgi:hypothetical protein